MKAEDFQTVVIIYTLVLTALFGTGTTYLLWQFTVLIGCRSLLPRVVFLKLFGMLVFIAWCVAPVIAYKVVMFLATL